MAVFPRIFKVFHDFRVDPGHHLVKLIAERVICARMLDVLLFVGRADAFVVGCGIDTCIGVG